MIRPDHFDVVFEAATERVQSSEPFEIRIRGTCMTPMLNDGDRVTVGKARLLLPGDVVVFRNDASFVAHRFLGWAPGRDGFGCVTRGDHCEQHDGVIAWERVLGRVMRHVAVADRFRALGAFLMLVIARLRRGAQ